MTPRRRITPTFTALLALFLSLMSGAGTPAGFAQVRIADYLAYPFAGSYAPISGSQGPAGDDDAMDLLLPFTFLYDGSICYQIRISTNGWVELGNDVIPVSTTTAPGNKNLFTPETPHRTIAPWWDDLATGTGAIEYASLGVSPNRVFVVEWQNVLSDYLGGRSLNFQVRLYETGGVIEFWYGDTSGTPSPNESASFGIETFPGGPGYFIDGPTRSRTAGTTTLTTTSDWPGVFYRFMPTTLFLDRPNGGEYFFIGSVDTIRWRSGTADSVSLEYSTDAGSSWSLIAGSVPAPAGAYPWTVPNTPTAQARVRATVIDDTNVVDVSAANFTIQEPPVLGVDPESLAVTLLDGDTAVRSITIANTGTGNLVWRLTAELAAEPVLFALPPVADDAAAVSIDRAGLAERAAFMPAAGAATAGPASVLLGDLTGKFIGFYGGATGIVSDLEARGASIRYLSSNVAAWPLDTLDVLVIDDAVGGLSAAHVATIHGWVMDGGALLLQGDDDYSMANINGLLAGSGIVETSLMGYEDGIFTDILPHPSTVGVDTVLASAYGSFCTISNPAQAIVRDDSGRVHIAVSRLGVGRVCASANEVTAMVSATFGDTRLFVNQMFDWLALFPDFITVSPDSGTVAPASTADLSIVFNAVSGPGDYGAVIVIRSNDPANPEVPVPALMHVEPAPDLTLSQDTLDFGDAFIGYGDTLLLRILNSGSDTLRISGMTTDNPVFSIGGPASLDLAPDTFADAAVVFLPAGLGPESGTLTMASNDSSDLLATAYLLGNGIHPPVITVSPESISVTINEGDTADTLLTIGNTGLGVLQWSADVTRPPSLRAFTLPAASIASGGEGQERSAGSAGPNLAAAAAGPERALAPLEAALDSLSGIRIGIPIGYSTILSDLQMRGAAVTQFSVPFDTLMLDSLDVLAVDDIVTSWQPSTVGAVRTWVQEGNSLLIEGDDASSMTMINALLSGTGMTETAYPVFLDGIFTDILAHPITAGVDTITAVSYGSYCTAAPPAETIVLDDSGHAHVAVSTLGLGTVVAAANEIMGSLGPFGDTRLLVNQIFDWLAFRSSYLRLSPESGSVGSGGSQEVTVTIDATEIPGGDYAATILVRSNDPARPTVETPFFMHVTGMPNIALPEDSLDFGNAFIGYGDTLALRIRNTGSVPLEVHAIASDNERFSVAGDTVMTVAPESHRDVPVVLTAAAPGLETGTLTIASNDPSDSLVTVHLRGTGVYAPAMTVDPESLAVTLAEGDSTTRTITIENTGLGELHWTVRTESPAGNGAIPAGADAAVSAQATIRILSWVRYTDLAGEYQNTLSAIQSHFTEFTVDTTRAMTPSELEPLLADKDVFLLPEQELAGGLAGTGSALAAPLTDFVNRGGTMIVMDHVWGGSTTFLNATGLLSIGSVNAYDGYAVVHDTGSPLTAGLPRTFYSMNGSNFHSSSDGVKIVRDSLTGYNRVTLKEAGLGRVVYLGMDFFSYNADMALLLANTVRSSGARYLSIEPDSGTVLPGESADVTVQFNASNLRGGSYDATVVVEGDDPANETEGVFTHLHVIGIPNIELAVDTLDFGSAFVGYPDTLAMLIVNTGTDTLVVDGLNFNNPRFAAAEIPPLKIPQGGNFPVHVLFMPVSTTIEQGTLSLTSNDPDDSVKQVALAGTGIRHAAATADPESLAFALFGGDSATTPVDLFNAGPSGMTFSAAVEYGSAARTAGAATGRAASSAGWMGTITMTDSLYAITDTFGVQPGATYGLDAFLGEEELPPPPPAGVRDMRFVDLPGRAPLMGQGARVDYRGYSSESQIDTFLVRYQADPSNFPLTFVWPAGMDAFVSRLRMIDQFGGVIINNDMLQTTMATFQFSYPDRFYIIAEGITPWLSVAPAAGTVDSGEGLQLQVTVRTAGLTPRLYHGRIVLLSDRLLTGSLVIPVRLDLLTGAGEPDGTLPTGFLLRQNYPNPFNPSTTIGYDLPGESHVRLTLENVLGQEIATLVDGRKRAGRHEIVFDARNLPSGVYFYRLQAGGFTDAKKLVLMK